jgi:hypothetical protein
MSFLTQGDISSYERNIFAQYKFSILNALCVSISWEKGWKFLCLTVIQIKKHVRVLCTRHTTCSRVLSVAPLFSIPMLNHLILRVLTIRSEMTTERSVGSSRHLQYTRMSHTAVCVCGLYGMRMDCSLS